MPNPIASDGASAGQGQGAGKIAPSFVIQLCALAIVFAVVATRPGVWNTPRIVGLCIAIVGAIFFMTARWQLGRSFSLTPQARELVTWGLYSKIRNPIYVSGVIFLVGILIALQRPFAFLVLLILIPMQIFRAHKEAAVLEAKFGDQYRKYREGAWF
jgi:protein-S-isoprenylcysteine O-methyltransferase Ste14